MRIRIRVISQKGTCHLNHKLGDEVIVSENRIEGNICIHALYSLLPKAFALMYGADFPWVKDGEKPKHACPDGINQVIFEFERIE